MEVRTVVCDFTVGRNDSDIKGKLSFFSPLLVPLVHSYQLYDSMQLNIGPFFLKSSLLMPGSLQSLQRPLDTK